MNGGREGGREGRTGRGKRVEVGFKVKEREVRAEDQADRKGMHINALPALSLSLLLSLPPSLSSSFPFSNPLSPRRSLWTFFTFLALA